MQLLEGTGTDVEKFNKGLAACTSEEERLQYMLDVSNGLLSDAAREYETMNASIMEARDADARLTEATAALGESFSPVLSGIKNAAAGFLEELCPSIEETISWVSGLVDSFTQKIPEMSAAAELSSQEFLMSQGIFETTVDEFGYSVATVSQQMVDDFDSAIKKTKDMVDFTWSLPKPKVPEFSMKGKFALDPPSVPKIQVTWNAAGGIFAEPMILPAMDGSLQGFGEAGREAILPLDSFYSQLEDILTRRGGGGTQLVVDVNIEHFDNSSGQDPREFAWAVMDELNVKLQQKGAAIG